VVELETLCGSEIRMETKKWPCLFKYRRGARTSAEGVVKRSFELA
jgi:hypothetical protein